VGAAPRDARPEDLICVLLGCRDPLVRCPVENIFEVVLPCYVAGIMQGGTLAMVESGKLNMVDIKSY